MSETQTEHEKRAARLAQIAKRIEAPRPGAYTMSQDAADCRWLYLEVLRLTRQVERERTKVKRLRKAFWEWLTPRVPE